MAHYSDIEIIGSGGFGEVTLCERDTDHQKFAKKRLTDTSDEAIRRFVREVRLLSSLDHPHVVKVTGSRLKKEPYFYVMPLYSNSLDKILPQIVSDLHRIEAIFSRILDAVAYAHEQGVIHRDLKPQNVLLNSDTDVVVSDFGLGRQLESESTRMTSTGRKMGTELYMAPEQFVDSKSVDARCDVFALGRMLTVMCTGLLSPGTQDLTSVPPRIQAIIRRATHHDPDRRFDSAVEFKSAWLQAFKVSAKFGKLETLQRLIAEYAANSDALQDENIETLVNLLMEHLDDLDEIHSAIMELPAKVVAHAFEQHPDEMTTIIEAFCRFITCQSWPFDYTDTLATQCHKIFDRISSAEVRAKLAVSVAEIGEKHNRWFVMRRAANMIEHAGVKDEDALVHEFVDISSRARERIAEYLSVKDLPAKLQELFAE